MKNRLVELSAVLLLCLAGCREVAVPKPEGHFRIDLPAKSYLRLDSTKELTQMPFSFEYPAYAQITTGDENYRDAEGWFNLEFPQFGARLYLTYKAIDSNFESLMEQTYRMNVKNHISKADAINEKAFINEERRVYGILYDLKGNTATAVQFYATDSVRHYLRGSLYFNAEPDADSLAPVINFFREDVIHIVETLQWNE